MPHICRDAIRLTTLLLALSLLRAAPATAQGGAATLNSTLTSITAQVLFLSSTVTPASASSFTWSFTLTNPTTNTAQIRSFTVAPNCDLTGVTAITAPPGWAVEVFAAASSQDPTLESNRITWSVPVTGTPLLFLRPGQSKTFSFQLAHGADPEARGRAGALDAVGFTGETLGCAPPTPQAQTQALIDAVEGLVSAGVLSEGVGNSLISKLEAAIDDLERGNPTPAANLLDAFVNELEALIQSGHLPEAQGQALIDAAAATSARLRGE